MKLTTRRLASAIFFVIVVTAAVPVLPQSNRLPNSPGTWKPWKPFSASNSAVQQQKATPALVKAFEAELLALNAILRKASGVATPVGFSVETWGNVDGYHVHADAPGQPPPGALPIAGGFTFGAFPIFEYERNGKMIRSDTGETALQPFMINQISASAVNTGNILEFSSSAVDHDAFLRPMPQGEIAGLPRYGDTLVIARDPAALWTPLSQRAALDIIAKARQGAVAGFEESMAKYAERLAIVRDPAWRAKRMKEAQDAAAKMPNPQAFIKTIEESIRIEEASLVKEMGPATGTGKNLADAQRALSDVTGWIAELSPAQQAAPSCYAAKGTTLRTRFPITASADCHPIVRPNYGYFNKALPRSAPQVVIITGIKRCFDTADKYNRDANETSPAGCRANRALVETMDKAAIRAWLR